MSWRRDRLAPVERHLFQSELVKVGEFDCPGDHDCFPVTERIENNVFVLATKPLWFRRNTPGFQYVGPGGVLLHPSGACLERQRGSAAHDLSYWFAIRPDVFAEIAATHGIDNSPPTRALCPNPATQLEFSVLLRRIRENSTTMLDVEAGVISLLDSILATSGAPIRYEQCPRARTNSRARARRQADAAKSIVDENLAENLDIKSVAAAVGVSPFHLCRLFKTFNDITLHEYRIRQRLTFVMHKLADRAPENLTRLALDAGFSSHSHLTRVFTNRLGIAPSAARSLT